MAKYLSKLLPRTFVFHHFTVLHLLFLCFTHTLTRMYRFRRRDMGDTAFETELGLRRLPGPSGVFFGYISHMNWPVLAQQQQQLLPLPQMADTTKVEQGPKFLSLSLPVSCLTHNFYPGPLIHQSTMQGQV
jgi:hypothetical protein